MAEQYWIRREDKTSGPFSASQLKQMASAGMVVASDLISADEMNWTAPDGLPELSEQRGPPADGLKTIPGAEAAAPTAQKSGSATSEEQKTVDCHAEAGPATVSRLPVQPPECSLLHAIARADLEQVKLHLAWGTDVDRKFERGLTPLHEAVEYARWAREKGEAEEDSVSGDAREPEPTEAERMAVVEFFLAMNADVNAMDEGGHTPLHVAVQGDNLELVEYLIGMGANVDAAQKGRSVPLTLVDRPKMAKLLVAHGARIDIRDSLGRTPLYFFVDCGRLDIIRTVFEELERQERAKWGGDWDKEHFAARLVNMGDMNGRTPLDMARPAEEGLIGSILNRINDRIERGTTAEMQEIADILRSHGATRWSWWWLKRELWAVVLICCLAMMVVSVALKVIGVISWSLAGLLLIGSVVLLFMAGRGAGLGDG